MRLKSTIRFATLVAAALGAGCGGSFSAIRKHAMIHSGEVRVLDAGGGSRVLVTPALCGRVLTSKVGTVQSVGFVSADDIVAGDSGAAFNNFGGQDRLWIGPESGQFGLYFEPGGEVTREAWRVPADLNKGAMKIVSDARDRLELERDMAMTNYMGTRFRVRVRREIGLIRAGRLNEEIGVPLPEGVSYVGSYSLNSMTNTGEDRWSRETGVLCLWVLGQFNAGPRAVVIAPFLEAAQDAAGRPYDDDYFGSVPADRLKVLDNAVLFRADASGEGKFGIGPAGSTGFAGSYDPDRDLLVIVRFDVFRQDPLYASFHWGKRLEEPFGGDVFQSYNAGTAVPGERNEKWPFYELESVSPCRELGPGESIVHRHATFAFQGARERLAGLARGALGVDLDAVVDAMGGDADDAAP